MKWKLYNINDIVVFINLEKQISENAVSWLCQVRVLEENGKCPPPSSKLHWLDGRA